MLKLSATPPGKIIGKSVTVVILGAASLLVAVHPTGYSLNVSHAVPHQSPSPFLGEGFRVREITKTLTNKLYRSYPLTFFGAPATAQGAVTDGEIAQFAKSVWEIEQKRQQAYNEIKKINNGVTPPINCSDADSLNGLGREVRELAVNFCEESKIIATNNGLTVSRFNQIQMAYQNDAQVKQKVDAELIRIQRESIIN
ncbi:DUF4168 domain-containing protein [[Phormidium] sp. ETS-05]|uniref:DUF4168 domain-containing protein n=1 Tax=[Phormidium] sp. ETS-05 TaxID=222819 RepID=UPI0018EF0386|nr:DUF4168 domain-containing protein [[Phormidium] sp. ETS-05]